MAKSTTEHDTQSEPVEPVELEKRGDAYTLGATPADGATASDGSDAAGGDLADGDLAGEDPAGGDLAEKGSAEVAPRKRGRRARRAAAAARAKAAETSEGEATQPSDVEKAGADGAGGPTARRGKRKAAATAAGTGPAPPADTATGARGLGSGRLGRTIGALLVLALLLGVVLVIQVIKGPGDASKIAARTDRADAARQMADTQVARLFSFDYKTLDADFKAQRDVTTGPFTQEIENVTNPAVRPLAAKEHVVVQAVSLGSAVVDDSGSDVQVLVYLNQAVTLDLLPAPRLDRNRVLATMRLVDGQWKVAGIKAL